MQQLKKTAEFSPLQFSTWFGSHVILHFKVVDNWQKQNTLKAVVLLSSNQSDKGLWNSEEMCLNIISASSAETKDK